MKKSKQVIGVSIVALLFVTCFAGCMQQPGPGGNVIIIPGVSLSSSDNPKNLISQYYSSEEITIAANSPQYTLPLDLVSITNFNSIDNVFTFTEDQKELLRANGFVVTGFGSEDDITEPYSYLQNHDIPIVVTTDTILHLYHILFDQTLKGIEEREFFDNLLYISETLFEKSKEDYSLFSEPQLKEAARRNVGFFAVALSLLQTRSEDYNDSEDITTVSFSIPSYVTQNVTTELSYIQAHDGFEKSALFQYKEDYSQYKPRGHYTQSEKLKRYFKAMMWYGRIAFLLRESDIISQTDAEIATIQACLISTALPSETVGEQALQTIWERIYAVTAFFVGTADDLIPFEYLSSIETVFGSRFNASEFINESKMLTLRGTLAQLRSPQIYGGTGNAEIQPPFSKEQLSEVLEKTKGMRFMGQRFIPDSYMFQNLVFPTTGQFTGTDTPFTYGSGQRIMPRGLDIMVLLGSTRARQLLDNEGDTAYVFYDRQIHNLEENFSSFTVAEWNRNLYWGWLFSLQPLLESFDTQYPTFMQTDAWKDKELQTTLASWTELRHDTILYAKQSYTPKLTAIPPQQTAGYVEPVPEFYQRILALTNMTRTGLTDLQVINETETMRLISLETIIKRLLTISSAELEGEELTPGDYQFIDSFGEHLDEVITGVNAQGKQTTIVADVHTDTNSAQVLEEAVGYVNLLVVAYKTPDGQILLGAGPVFSYYEFKQPMSDRLTDEEWKTLLETGQQPLPPQWIENFTAE